MSPEPRVPHPEPPSPHPEPRFPRPEPRFPGRTLPDGVVQQLLPLRSLGRVAAEQGPGGSQGGRGLLAAAGQRQHVGKEPDLLLQQRRDLPVVLLDAVWGDGDNKWGGGDKWG